MRKTGEASALLESIDQYQRRMDEKEAIILEEERMEEDIKVGIKEEDIKVGDEDGGGYKGKCENGGGYQGRRREWRRISR